MKFLVDNNEIKHNKLPFLDEFGYEIWGGLTGDILAKTNNFYYYTNYYRIKKGTKIRNKSKIRFEPSPWRTGFNKVVINEV
jgi:hypothetical protein